MLNIFSLLIFSTLRQWTRAAGTIIRFSSSECQITVQSLEFYYSKNCTITQRIQKLKITLKIYRWYLYYIYILQLSGRLHVINASLATSCIWHSMLYPHFKAPKNRLLFLKLLPIALIISESLSSLLPNRNIPWELSYFSPSEKNIFGCLLELLGAN